MNRSSTIVIAAVLVVLTACVTSNQARDVRPGGFLGDSASLLKKGDKDETLLVYRNTSAKWTSYDKIILDPVTMWGVEKSTLPPDALADFQRLVDAFHRTLEDKLSKDYQIDRYRVGRRDANSDRDHQRKAGGCAVEGGEDGRPICRNRRHDLDFRDGQAGLLG